MSSARTSSTRPTQRRCRRQECRVWRGSRCCSSCSRRRRRVMAVPQIRSRRHFSRSSPLLFPPHPTPSFLHPDRRRNLRLRFNTLTSTLIRTRISTAILARTLSTAIRTAQRMHTLLQRSTRSSDSCRSARRLMRVRAAPSLLLLRSPSLLPAKRPSLSRPSLRQATSTQHLRLRLPLPSLRLPPLPLPFTLTPVTGATAPSPSPPPPS